MRGCWCLGGAGYLTRQISGLRKVFSNLSTIHKTCLSTLPSDTRLSLKFCPRQGSLWQISKVAFWRRTYSALSYTQGRQPLITSRVSFLSSSFCIWKVLHFVLESSRGSTLFAHDNLPDPMDLDKRSLITATETIRRPRTEQIGNFRASGHGVQRGEEPWCHPQGGP